MLKTSRTPDETVVQVIPVHISTPVVVKSIVIEVNQGVEHSYQCQHCDMGIITRHCCLTKVPHSRIVLLDDFDVHICGKTFCVMCLEKWKIED